MALSLPLAADRPDRGAVAQLRERMLGMQDGAPRLPVAMSPELTGLLQLRTGGSYQVDNASLALALLAAPSRAGGWTAVIGAGDLGIEAAAEMGVDLTRTVLVPHPGEHWLEVTAALVDVVPMLLLRPPMGVTQRVTQQVASRIGARLRKRASTLLVWGDWPGSEARLSLTGSVWYGAEAGHGRLRSRQVTVACQRGTAPARRTTLWLPAADAPIRRIEERESEPGRPEARGVG